jgi:hypothetical protein
MSEFKIPNNNDCLLKIKLSTNDDVHMIHPQLNLHLNIQPIDIPTTTNDICMVQPQLFKNKVLVMKTMNKTNDISVNFNIDEKKQNSTPKKDVIIEAVCMAQPIMNFIMPINSNNWLDIVCNIQTVDKLDNFIRTLNSEESYFNTLIDLVLNLFWKNYYHIVDNDIKSFIKLNKKIIDIIFNKDISDKIATKITNKFIRNNYGKKIKYLEKIQKYLNKYLTKHI